LETLTKVQHILIVDDDDISTFVTRKCIENSGFAGKVSTERMAENALRKIKDYVMVAGLPGLIFLDVQMPQMDGFQFLEQLEGLNISDSYHRPRVVMISSSSEDLDKAKEMNHRDVVDYVEKPLKLNSFREIVERFA
jgi:CheY-like chemotaxis protein